MAFGGGHSNRGAKNGSATWMSTSGNQWNLSNQNRREVENDEWNQTGQNISNNLEWQSQKATPANTNKNKRKSNANKNTSRVVPTEDIADSCELVEENPATNFPRTKFTASAVSMQNGLNGARQKVHTFQEESTGEGDRNETARSQKRTWRDEPNTTIKNISKNVESAGNDQVNDIISQLPNANQIIERLKQIRDYMKQVACMIDTLHKSGDHRVVERMNKLQKVYSDLQCSEKQLIDLLNQISRNKNLRQIIKFSKLMNDLESQESECLNVLHHFVEMRSDQDRPSAEEKSESSSVNSDDDEDFDSSQPYNPPQLLKSVIENGSKGLDSIQLAKRNELLKKVAESQEKLKALQDQQATLLALQRKAENHLAQAKSLSNQSINVQPEATTPVEIEATASRVLQDDLEGLQDRLNALKDLYDNRQRAESMSRSVDTDDRSEEPEVLTEMQRQELQNKLQDLQEKKNYMDSLLQELKSLPAMRAHDMNNSENFSEKIKDGTSASCIAKQTLDDAQEILTSLDLNEKLGNLKDMKQRLRYLQGLVAHYPADPADADEFLENGSSSYNQNHALARTSSAEQISTSRKQNEKKIIKPQKRDNLNRNDMNCDVIGNIEKEESDDNSVLVVTMDEDETQRQLLRLQKAKDKLCRLQDLLTSVNDAHHASDGKPDIVQQLLENLDKVEDRGLGSQGASSEQFVENAVDENLHRERKRRSGFIALQAQEQAPNIDHLIEESHRLLENQEQFNLNQKHTNNIHVTTSTTNRSYEQPRLVAGKSETKVPPVKHNATKLSARLKHANQNSVHKVGDKRITLDAESSNGELMTSNHEIWSEVRQRFILREELRQKKRELEELMKKDKGKTNSRNQDNMSDNVSYSNKSEALGLSYVGTEGTTVATWGGSTQGNLDEDQEEQNESQEELENEIEEEIEEEFPAEDRATAANAASGRNDNRFTQPKGTRTDAADLNASGDKPTGAKVTIAPRPKTEINDRKKSWEKVPLTRDTVHNWNNHSNLRQTERQNVPESDESFQPPVGTRPELAHALWQQQALQFMQQLEQTNIHHHSILRDQSYLANLLQQMNTSAGSPQSESFQVQFPEMIQHLTHQLQHQQQLANLHQCHHLLYLQQMEIQQLQRQLQQILNVDLCSQNVASDEATTHCANTNAEQTEFHSLVHPPWFSSNHIVPMTSAQMTNAISTSGTNLFPANFLNPDQLSPGSQTLNNQVAPGIRTNNYWDNFRSYSRQNLLSAASGNKSGSGNVMLNPRAAALMQNRHLLATQPGVPEAAAFRQGESTSLQEHVMVDSTAFQRMRSTAGVPKLDLERLATKSKPKKDKVNQNNHQTTDVKSSQRTQVAGASVRENDAANVAAKIGINGCNANETGASSTSAVSFDSFVREGMAAYFANNPEQRCPNSFSGSDDMNEKSLFDSLWTSIYGEVAVLLSRNENRPHFLIQMFKELQKLNSDYLRQHALSLLTELISRLNLESDANFPKMHSRNRRQFDQVWSEPTNTTSELQANESVATSDEDEFRMSKSAVKESSSASKSQCHGIHGQHFDYAEQAESGATVSSPSTSAEQPLTSSVVETLAQVNKVKEVNQQKQKSFPMSTSHSSPLPSTMCQSLSEDAISSAQDGASEMSSSELPYSELNSKQLDDQIQSIMLEVIPFLKAHLDDICSPRLLLSLQQLIIFLVTQRDEAMELTQLFRKRLTSALQVTLAKYTGKRLRDCGEALLVDTSEVLFGELAFVHLVQNVDSVNNARGKMRSFQTFSETLSSLGNDNEGSPRKEDSFTSGVRKTPTSTVGADVEATDADECLVAKMEEDELGQSRDDAMAAKCDIFDNENGSRPPSINSFKEGNTHNEHDSSYRAREYSPIESVSPTGANAVVVGADASSLRQEQDSGQQQISMGEIDNEADEGLADNLDLAEADQPQNLLDRSAHPVSENEYEHSPHLNEQASGVEATEDDQLHAETGGIHDCAHNEAILGAEGGFEQGLDEVPIKLLPLIQREISARRSEEESLNNLVDEILNDSVEAELAENFSLRQPDSQ